MERGVDRCKEVGDKNCSCGKVNNKYNELMLQLIAERRSVFGKRLSRSRKAGRLPVVIYGHKEKATPYFINASQFKKVYKEAGESTVISLKDGLEEKDILVHEVSFDPVTDEVNHADFYVIEKGKKVKVKIPLVFIGVAPAVKALGGILVKVMHEIEIEAEAKDLPHNIKVDIGALASFGNQITVANLDLIKGVRFLAGGEEVIALVAQPKEEKEEEAPVDLSKIEVEKKGKKPEEAVAEEAPKGTKDEKKDK